MQKFNGIYMGRRRKQTGEVEADMEGSGEDSQPRGLATLTRELRKSIHQTKSTLVNHLQESHLMPQNGSRRLHTPNLQTGTCH
jgi:hypothetical protein